MHEYYRQHRDNADKTTIIMICITQAYKQILEQAKINSKGKHNSLTKFYQI